jgi:hypothetical protein
MRFLKWEIHTSPRDVVEVQLQGSEADVMLLDNVNLQNYREGRGFRYYGGHATRSPVLLRPPHPGQWYVIVDAGGSAVRAGVRLRRA